MEEKVSKVEPFEVVEEKIRGTKIVGLVSGLGLIILGVIMMFTIILILPGLGCGLIGGLILHTSMPKHSAICPACDSEILVIDKAKTHECESCSRKAPVKWL